MRTACVCAVHRCRTGLNRPRTLLAPAARDPRLRSHERSSRGCARTHQCAHAARRARRRSPFGKRDYLVPPKARPAAARSRAPRPRAHRRTPTVRRRRSAPSPARILAFGACAHRRSPHTAAGGAGAPAPPAAGPPPNALPAMASPWPMTSALCAPRTRSRSADHRRGQAARPPGRIDTAEPSSASRRRSAGGPPPAVRRRWQQRSRPIEDRPPAQCLQQNQPQHSRSLPSAAPPAGAGTRTQSDPRTIAC